MRAPDTGETFGPYRIDSKLGMGGMGVVYAATDQRLSRTVALKVISGTFAADEEFRARFHREAEVLARIDSPHIVQIYEHGEHAGTPYIATQFIRGGDLGQAINQHGAFPPQLAAQVCAQVADALQDAHEAGVIHRDVKPANVLLRNANFHEPHAYLCDFGIAQTESRGFTATGGVVGTWTYLSPERINGAPATPASDIYSLGCLLWACLTGTAPYAGSDIQVAMAHINSPVPHLTAQDPVSQAMNGVLARSLAKEPGQRYATASQLRQDLQQLAQGRLPAVSKPAPEPAYQDPPTMRPHDVAPTMAPYAGPSAGAHAQPPHAATGGGPSGKQAAIALSVLVGVIALAVAIWVGWRVVDGPGNGPSNPADVPTKGSEGAKGGGDADPSGVAADFDGDGLGDIGFRDFTDSSAEYFTATSDGKSSFSSPVSEDTESKTQVLRGDFDDDGASDLVTLRAPGKIDTATVSISWGASADEVSAGQELQLGDAHEYTGGVTGDYDGDGTDDLALFSGEAKGELELWVALSSGERDGEIFETPVRFGSTTWDVDSTWILGGRFDEDGEAGLAVVTDPASAGDAATVEILTNDGTSFESSGAPRRIQPNGTEFPLPVAGDFDGDELTEIVLFGVGGAVVVQAEGGSVDEGTEWLAASEELIHATAAASDVDGDGDDDLVAFRKLDKHWSIDVLHADGDSFGTPIGWGRYDCPGACDPDSVVAVNRW